MGREIVRRISNKQASFFAKSRTRAVEKAEERNKSKREARTSRWEKREPRRRWQDNDTNFSKL